MGLLDINYLGCLARTSAFYPTNTIDSLSPNQGGQFEPAEGGQFEMAEGGQFSSAKGGQFEWVFQPEEIAALYKHRWKVELFFKWIKQHLKIKSFWGITENAVKTQVYIAVITYTLVAIIRQRLKSTYTTYEVLQILGSSLLDKTPINQLLKKPSDQDVKELLYNQLKIW
jgi:transposase